MTTLCSSGYFLLFCHPEKYIYDNSISMTEPNAVHFLLHIKVSMTL